LDSGAIGALSLVGRRVRDAVMVGPATRARENTFSTNAGICARRGRRRPNDSTDVENPVDKSDRIPANALFRRSASRGGLCYTPTPHGFVPRQAPGPAACRGTNPWGAGVSQRPP